MAINELQRFEVCKNVCEANVFQTQTRSLSNLITSLSELPSGVLETEFKKSIKNVFISRVILRRNVLAAPRHHSLLEANIHAAHFQFCCCSRIFLPHKVIGRSHQYRFYIPLTPSALTWHFCRFSAAYLANISRSIKEWSVKLATKSPTHAWNGGKFIPPTRRYEEEWLWWWNYWADNW